jgi:hypothetical protein
MLFNITKTVATNETVEVETPLVKQESKYASITVITDEHICKIGTSFFSIGEINDGLEKKDIDNAFLYPDAQPGDAIERLEKIKRQVDGLLNILHSKKTIAA